MDAISRSFLPLAAHSLRPFFFFPPRHGPPHFMSTSKSSTSSLVSSVPLRLPTAQTSLVLEALMRHTTPPLPPLSRVTRFRMNSPVFRSHNLTVPSSELVMTKFLLNWRHVTALWCLCGPKGARETDGQRRIKGQRVRTSFRHVEVSEGDFGRSPCFTSEKTRGNTEGL